MCVCIKLCDILYLTLIKLPLTPSTNVSNTKCPKLKEKNNGGASAKYCERLCDDSMRASFGKKPVMSSKFSTGCKTFSDIGPVEGWTIN